MYALPRGTKVQCSKILTARTNVDELMKRQVFLHRQRKVMCCSRVYARDG